MNLLLRTTLPRIRDIWSVRRLVMHQDSHLIWCSLDLVSIDTRGVSIDTIYYKKTGF